MFQIVSSPSFKHLRFDFFNMTIPTRFGILAFLNPTQIGELHEITIKSWMEATSLQPSIPMWGVKKMLRLPSLKLTKFAKNGWDHHNDPRLQSLFLGPLFLFRLFSRGETPPSSAHRPSRPLNVGSDVVVSLKEKPQPPRVNPLDLLGGGSRRDSSWWVEMIFVTDSGLNHSIGKYSNIICSISYTQFLSISCWCYFHPKASNTESGNAKKMVYILWSPIECHGWFISHWFPCGSRHILKGISNLSFTQSSSKSKELNMHTKK